MTKRSPQRTCVGCREVVVREKLIRMAVSPEGQLVPDLKCRLPGRGAYVCWTGTCIAKAAGKGVLARTLRQPVAASEAHGLVKKVGDAVDRRILTFLGVLMKGNKILVGRESIRKSLQKGQVHLLVQAADVEEGLPDSATVGIPVRVLFSRDQLGHAVGRAPQPVLGILDAGGGRELLRWIDRKKGLNMGGGE